MGRKKKYKSDEERKKARAAAMRARRLLAKTKADVKPKSKISSSNNQKNIEAFFDNNSTETPVEVSKESKEARDHEIIRAQNAWMARKKQSGTLLKEDKVHNFENGDITFLVKVLSQTSKEKIYSYIVYRYYKKGIKPFVTSFVESRIAGREWIALITNKTDINNWRSIYDYLPVALFVLRSLQENPRKKFNKVPKCLGFLFAYYIVKEASEEFAEFRPLTKYSIKELEELLLKRLRKKEAPKTILSHWSNILTLSRRIGGIKLPDDVYGYADWSINVIRMIVSTAHSHPLSKSSYNTLTWQVKVCIQALDEEHHRNNFPEIMGLTKSFSNNIKTQKKKLHAKAGDTSIRSNRPFIPFHPQEINYLLSAVRYKAHSESLFHFVLLSLSVAPRPAEAELLALHGEEYLLPDGCLNLRGVVREPTNEVPQLLNKTKRVPDLHTKIRDPMVSLLGRIIIIHETPKLIPHTFFTTKWKGYQWRDSKYPQLDHYGNVVMDSKTNEPKQYKPFVKAKRYNLRTTCATMYRICGEFPKEMLGHTTDAMAINHYTKLMPQLNKASIHLYFCDPQPIIHNSFDLSAGQNLWQLFLLNRYIKQKLIDLGDNKEAVAEWWSKWVKEAKIWQQANGVKQNLSLAT